VKRTEDERGVFILRWLGFAGGVDRVLGIKFLPELIVFRLEITLHFDNWLISRGLLETIGLFSRE